MPSFSLKSTLSILAFLIAFTPSLNSQQIKNYDSEWKKVQALTDKGLPKSALEEVKKIYATAKSEKQDAQVIKAVIYLTTLQTENRDNNEVFSISEIEKEIISSREPVKSILTSFLASMYYNYYQQHRWQLYNRTKTENFNKTDLATWDAEDFHKRISELYLQSVREEKLLQQTKLEPYDAIIIKGNVRHLRPTLYDLLVHRALNYFKNDERDIKKPAYAFEIEQANAFDPAIDFIKRSFPTKDSLSLQHKALLLYQKLVAFHIRDPKPDALIDVDLQRLEYVNSKSTHPDKNKLYFIALNHIATQYGNLPAAAQAWYLLASWYENKAAEYKPFGDTTYRFARIKAREILERVVAQKDSSEGKYNSINLLQSIKKPSFEFNVEKVNIPGQPFRALFRYKNVPRLYLRIIKADETLKKLLESPYDEKYWPGIIAAQPIRSWQQSLPATNDLQQHAVELKVDALPHGDYMLLASNTENFKSAETILGARLFYVSSISYVNNGNDFFVLNRDNGQPLSSANVQVWEQKYDYKQSKYIKQKGRAYTTDQNGFFRMEKNKREVNDYSTNTYLLDIIHNNDRLFMNDLIYDYYYSRDNQNEPKITTSVHLFTDRSIYRPGQTLYFKGIVLLQNPKEKKNNIRAEYTATVFLRDANYKDVDSLKLKTNEFGSFSGIFQLPQAGLNGQFTLYTKTDGGNTSFRVEEYKRPKFYVEYESVKGTYRVNDKITITGIAKAYAGNNIDGADVKYRVVRQPRYIYSWMFWRWWQPPTASMEIAHGEVKTDKDGKFVIQFTAIPDLTIDKKFEPVFDYTVYADVTDINGETRSGEEMVSVSYKSLMLYTNLSETIVIDSFKTLAVRTQNMNGEFVPANVKITITKLKEEQRLIRKRYWERPDQFVMSREEYNRNFPYDEYDNESDMHSWAKGEIVLEKIDSARADGTPLNILPASKFKPGFYLVEVETKDKNGELVKDVKYVELFDQKNNKLNRPGYIWTGTEKTTVEPGETAIVELGTTADNLFIIHQVSRNQEPNPAYSFLKLSDEKKTFSFNAGEEDRGGFGASWLFVKHNRFYVQTEVISVPWTNKDLTIEYATFRDKTLPGSKETWKLKIKGYKNEKVAAEMLAAMYDASLDQFYYHGWSEPYVWSTYYTTSYWTETHNFTQVESAEKTFSDPAYKYVNKQYDYLFYSDQVDYYTEGKVMAMGNAKRMKDGAQPPPEMVEQAKPEANGDKESADTTATTESGKKDGKPEGGIQVRKNFNETAFFFPDLKTDPEGNIEFSFTLPEALTRWKFMALAHTKDAAFGSSTKEIITQKDLMVQPNLPRFLREGDKMEISTKVVNLSDKEITGTAHLQLFDAATNEPLDTWFHSSIPNQYFTIAAGQSEAVRFPVEIPYQFNKALVWRIVAKAGAFSDGEENMLPVLTNRMLVTETMTLPVRGNGTKNFVFEKLKSQNGGSPSLQNHALTIEYTSNPVWYAVQALPYLMEYPYECAEQTWNRYYANSLASYIANSTPKLKQVFERWKIKDTAALMSNLQKNQELKAVLLEETPWVLQAKNEAEQKRNIALLFDMVSMSQQQVSAYVKLKQMQSSNGGFVWFTGGPDDRYMTQYIVTGIGHLQHLKASSQVEEVRLKDILQTAIPYLDRRIKEDYDDLVKYKADLTKQQIGYIQVQYLYMRSFFPDYQLNSASKTAYDFYYKQAQQFWVPQSKYMQGMIALALSRKGDAKTVSAILKSLKETAIVNDELGMYWKDQRRGWFWYEAPIETQSLLIEAFQEAGKDMETVDDLKTWLLKNKQTNNWQTTKATAEACYALLLQGTKWIGYDPTVEIKLGNTVVRSTDNKQEAGTGYFKTVIDGANVKPDMGNIAVTVGPSQDASTPGKGAATWGAVYWQYFEDLDKISTAATPLNLSKKLFKEKNTDRGPVITPVNDGEVLKVGDKIKVRIELRVDRDMEYVHMKDMRAAALEPVNVLSQYKYQGGLGYYETTRDASTNFFFNYLRKGTYVFEYTLFVTHTGNFSNGITTIQCMYAPEFSSHSEGIRINVE